MHNNPIPRFTLAIVGVGWRFLIGVLALIALATWLSRSNKSIEAATQQNPTAKPAVAVDTLPPPSIGRGAARTPALSESAGVRASIGVDSQLAVEAGDIFELTGL